MTPQGKHVENKRLLYYSITLEDKSEVQLMHAWTTRTTHARHDDTCTAATSFSYVDDLDRIAPRRLFFGRYTIIKLVKIHGFQNLKTRTGIVRLLAGQMRASERQAKRNQAAQIVKPPLLCQRLPWRKQKSSSNKARAPLHCSPPVSYTHLTLPTICSV